MQSGNFLPGIYVFNSTCQSPRRFIQSRLNGKYFCPLKYSGAREQTTVLRDYSKKSKNLIENTNNLKSFLSSQALLYLFNFLLFFQWSLAQKTVNKILKRANIIPRYYAEKYDKYFSITQALLHKTHNIRDQKFQRALKSDYLYTPYLKR